MQYFLYIIIFCWVGSYQFEANSTIDLTSNWTSKICPVHNKELKSTKVDIGNLGPFGGGCDDCKSYGQIPGDNPPYSIGSNPNAKYMMSQFTGCIVRYKKAKIYYCSSCEDGRKKTK